MYFMLYTIDKLYIEITSNYDPLRYKILNIKRKLWNHKFFYIITETTNVKRPQRLIIFEVCSENEEVS